MNTHRIFSAELTREELVGKRVDETLYLFWNFSTTFLLFFCFFQPLPQHYKFLLEVAK